MASAATLRDTPASSSPAPTDMAIAIAWCGIRENDPTIAPTSSPTEVTAPNDRATQTSSVLVGICGLGLRTQETSQLPRLVKTIDRMLGPVRGVHWTLVSLAT